MTTQPGRTGLARLPFAAHLLVGFTVLTVLAQPAALGQSGPGTGPVDEAAHFQTEQEALQQDLELVAAANGWTVGEATVRHEAAVIVGEIAVTVAADRPDMFVGSALSPDPGGAPTLYIKGPADPFVLDLVAAAEIDIMLEDNQPFSFFELESDKLEVHRALEALGFTSIATSFDFVAGGLITASVAAVEGVESDPEKLLALLPAHLRSRIVLKVSDTPFGSDTKAFGGMRVSGADSCTSGWSVENLDTGATGVTTAGHCTGIDEIVHPGHYVHALAFQAEHRGSWGDVEWHGSAQSEPDDFYATSSDIRDVVAVEPWAAISFEESICVYGRSSNHRDCSLEVKDVSITCTNAGVFNNRLVLMNGVVTEDGDSGGGWSFVNTAFGSVKGLCEPEEFDAFSVADYYDEALLVSVLR